MSNREALRGMYEAHQKAKAMTTPPDPTRRAPEIQRIIEAAQRVKAAQQVGTATGVAHGPDPLPEDFVYPLKNVSVIDDLVAALDAVLSAPPPPRPDEVVVRREELERMTAVVEAAMIFDAQPLFDDFEASTALRNLRAAVDVYLTAAQQEEE